MAFYLSCTQDGFWVLEFLIKRNPYNPLNLYIGKNIKHQFVLARKINNVLNLS